MAQLFVRRVKTKWGSRNPKASTVRLNTELAKKPVACLEYVLLHELAHLLEPKHDDRFRRNPGPAVPALDAGEGRVEPVGAGAC